MHTAPHSPPPSFAQRWPLWLLAVALAPLLVNRLAPPFLDADTILMALMSTQKLTLFYWGQNRYANVLPLLFSPIADLWWNLAAHLWAQAATYLLMLEAMADVLCQLHDQPPTRTRRLLLFGLLVALPLELLRPFALYQFAVSAQPYALSLLLLLWAAGAWRRRVVRRAWVLPCAVGVVAAIGVNPALVLIVLTFLALQAWRGEARPWLGFALLVLAAFAVWTALSLTYPLHGPSSYTQLALQTWPTALSQSATDLRNNAIFPRYFVLAAALLGLVTWACQPPPLPRALRQALGVAIVAGVGWWLFFLANRWVQDNGSPFRYFMPLLFAPLVALAAGYWHVLAARPGRWPSRLVVALCALAFTAFAVRPWLPLARYGVFAAAAEPVRIARAHRIRYFAGDYWLVWPAIFTLRAAGEPAFGVFSRGSVMRAEVAQAIRASQRRGAEPLVACVHTSVPQCQEQLREATGLDWRLAEVPSDGVCTFLRL